MRLELILPKACNPAFYERATEMHGIVIERTILSSRDHSSLCGPRVAISQRTKNPAVGNLVSRPWIVVPKRFDHFMDRMSIGFPGDVEISAVYSELNIIWLNR